MTDRASILARLARLTATNARERHLAQRLCDASRLILGVDGASITIETDTSNRITLAATDQTAARLEDLQDVLGQGPCRDAYRSGAAIAMQLGIDADQRWPEFTRAALEAVGRVWLSSYPMRPSRQAVFGTLSLYGTDNSSQHDAEAAQFLADAVGAALLRDPTTDEAVTGDSAWSSRARIHQATGMVIAQLRLPPDDALAILRAHAYAHDTTLTEIAAKVVQRQLDFSEGEV
jgi:hypothetical protein